MLHPPRSAPTASAPTPVSRFRALVNPLLAPVSPLLALVPPLFALVPPLFALTLAAATLLLSTAAPAARADEFRPKVETYLCPNVTGLGVDCFLDAVEHLYTMCRHVKSIEILEFGYEHAEDGVNGAKSEYCADKHRASIGRPFQAALREARGRPTALEGLKALHARWLAALVELKWQPPETDDDYKVRVSRPYDVFREQAAAVRTALAETPVKAPAAAKPAPRAANAGKKPAPAAR